MVSVVARFAALAFGLVSACGPKPATPPPDPADAALAIAQPPIRGIPAGPSEGPAHALGTRGAVTSQEGQASEVGLEILRRGGNAVDAAVATGLALAVTHPSAGNIGGGGFMVIRMEDGRNIAIDYRETAPGRAFRDMYLDNKGEPTGDSLTGPRAAGIPGVVAGLALAHEKYGSGALNWAQVVAPAIKLAREGNVIDAHHEEDLRKGVERMKKAGFDASATYYQKEDGSLFGVGDTWKQPELAATLEKIAQDPRNFYEGALAREMAKKVKAMGGIWEVEDLGGYRAKERNAIVFTYRGHEIVTMPPPSAGGVVLRQLLAASEHLKLHEMPWRSVSEVHHYVEAARRTYADRNLLLGDPDFVDLPIRQMLDVSYVVSRMSDIDPQKATPSEQVGAGVPRGRESEQTTHYSVIDGEGNAVSTTTTLNLGFGAKVVIDGVGVLLNNEMNDFSVKPGSPNVFGLVQGEPNRIESGKRMLSSMTPTVVVKGGEVRAVVGTPGGPTITTTVFQIIRAIVDHDMRIDQAVASVRIHHQWKPDMIWTEERIPQRLEDGLAQLGHQLRKRGSMGHANCIEVDPETRGFRAVADVDRDGGRAVAY